MVMEYTSPHMYVVLIIDTEIAWFTAVQAGTSFGYSRMHNYNRGIGGPQPGGAPPAGNRFLNSDNVFCIAICEGNG